MSTRTSPSFSGSTSWHRPKHRVDIMAAMHAMVREGLGVSILPCYTADRDHALGGWPPRRSSIPSSTSGSSPTATPAAHGGYGCSRTFWLVRSSRMRIFSRGGGIRVKARSARHEFQPAASHLSRSISEIVHVSDAGQSCAGRLHRGRRPSQELHRSAPKNTSPSGRTY